MNTTTLSVEVEKNESTTNQHNIQNSTYEEKSKMIFR